MRCDRPPLAEQDAAALREAAQEAAPEQARPAVEIGLGAPPPVSALQMPEAGERHLQPEHDEQGDGRARHDENHQPHPVHPRARRERPAVAAGGEAGAADEGTAPADLQDELVFAAIGAGPASLAVRAAEREALQPARDRRQDLAPPQRARRLQRPLEVPPEIPRIPCHAAVPAAMRSRSLSRPAVNP